jgi:hypothetical protein
VSNSGLIVGPAYRGLHVAAGIKELTTDPAFWDQCKACVNYPLLEAKGRKVCLCTAMVFDPKKMAI